MLRIAMLGYWAKGHADEFAEGVNHSGKARVTCVWDSSPRGKALSDRLGVPFYSHLDTLFEQENVDGVILNAEPWQNAEIAIAAAKRNKHILVDKIVAMGKEQEDRLRQVVNGRKIIFSTCFALQRREFYQTAHDVIASNRLGNIYSLHMREAFCRFPDGEKRDEQFASDRYGAFTDMGFHMLYLAPYLLEEDPVSVTAVAGHARGYLAEDNGTYTLSFKNGALAVHEFSYVTHYSPFEFAVYGDKGTLYMGGPYEKAEEIPPAISGARLEKHWGRCLINTDGEWEQLSPIRALTMPEVDFIDAILERRPPRFGLEDGLKKARMLDAVYQSLKTRSTVDICY